MFRLLRAMLMLVGLAVVLLVGAAWLGLERAARRAADTAMAPWAKRVPWERVHARVLPPAAVLENVRLANAEGDELLRAARVVLPLRPGAWTGGSRVVGAPHLEEFTLAFAVPRREPAAWAEALLDAELPPLEWWSGERGTVEVRLGEGSDAVELRVEDVTARRRKYSLHLAGTIAGRPGSDAVLDGGWDPYGKEPPRFELRAGPLEAAPWSAWLLDAREGRVRGGALHLSGVASLAAKRLRFDGVITARELLVEGHDAKPGALEMELRRKPDGTSFRIAFDGPIAAGADWRAQVRSAIAAQTQPR